jgi:hypothetical protein
MNARAARVDSRSPAGTSSFCTQAECRDLDRPLATLATFNEASNLVERSLDQSERVCNRVRFHDNRLVPGLGGHILEVRAFCLSNAEMHILQDI